MGAKTRGNYPHYPAPGMACPACCFGEPKHADFCDLGHDWEWDRLICRKCGQFMERSTPNCPGLERDESDFSIQAWPIDYDKVRQMLADCIEASWPKSADSL